MFFDHVKKVPADSIFGLREKYLKDSREEKVFLSMGVGQAKGLKTKLFDSVKTLLKKEELEKLGFDYLPIDGEALFCEEITKLILGESFFYKNHKRIYTAQSVGGTSALRTGAENIFHHLSNKVFLTNPTWDNHLAIFEKTGFKVFGLPYYDKKLHQFDQDSFYQSVESLPEKCALLLHGCCHNPTGEDLSKEQWEKLSTLLKRKKIIPFFDFAYQGLGEGVELDAFPIRLFAKQGHEMFVAYSCSKNFGLYGQRVGALVFVANKIANKQAVASHIKRFIRANYSNPPVFGAEIVLKILKNKKAKDQWLLDLEKLRKKIINIRKVLANELTKKTGKDFSFLIRQKGLFSLLGLNEGQTDLLQKKYAVYLPANGRINIAGLCEENIKYVVDAISKVFLKDE